jgi:hypothetical protein
MKFAHPGIPLKPGLRPVGVAEVANVLGTNELPVIVVVESCVLIRLASAGRMVVVERSDNVEASDVTTEKDVDVSVLDDSRPESTLPIEVAVRARVPFIVHALKFVLLATGG